MERKPKIAILRWEEGLVPQGLMQLEELPGNSTNPKSYPFPVRMIHVPGAWRGDCHHASESGIA